MTLRAMTICALLWACDDTTGDGATDGILSLSGDEVAGQALYTTNCVSCHSKDGSGGIGSNIQGADVELLVDAMLNGRSGMISYDDLLTDQEIADIAAYAETL